ncbi:P1 family peptidase [Micromonospora sp. BRA006-A]|nr:P1 family peptidase [Micromonospora sp. BRA006-A]
MDRPGSGRRSHRFTWEKLHEVVQIRRVRRGSPGLSGTRARRVARVGHPAAGAPGAHNAITDVPGIQVGQVQSDTAPYLTGTSVVYMPQMSVASVDQRGGAPATRGPTCSAR